MKKYFITLILIIGTTLTIAQTATQPSGSGTETDPYLIANLENLYWITQDENRWIGKYYKQTEDIDASETSGWTWTDEYGNSATGFKSIGNSNQSFTGNYDGQNHSINHLYMKRQTADNVGMFGNINEATVKNITLTDVHVESYYNGPDGNIQYDLIGGLVGACFGSTITNCSTSGSVYGGGSVGGLIGSANDESQIDNCSSSATVSGVSWVGGLIGTGNSIAITKSNSSGNVTGESRYGDEESCCAGGLIGYNIYGRVSECYSISNVSGVNYVGGFAGDNEDETEISDCYSQGNVSGSSYIGGFIGGNIEGGFAPVINNCYSSGNVSGDSETGGFIAYNEGSSEVNNCFWDTETSNQTSSAAGTGKTTSEMQTESTFTDAGWDFANIWYMNGYPDLSANPLPVELSLFTAKVENNAVELNWETATEVNNYGFEIERKQENENYWNKIAFIEGHGNSNSPKKYSFIDTTVSLQKYFYRLKQIDINGTFEYSDVIAVDVSSLSVLDNNMNISGNYILKQNFPNPFNPTTTIQYSIPVGAPHELPLQQHVLLKVYNILGKEVATLVNKNQEPGNYQISFDASGLVSGVYYYRLQSGNFIQAKKMILTK